MDRFFNFLQNNAFLTLVFVVLLLALIWTELARRLRRYREVTPNQLTLLINREDAAVIDVGAIVDFEKGHIAGARHMALSQFDPASKELQKLKGKPVALVCKAGHLSAQAASKLAAAGFEKVHWLGGGLNSWLAQDLPVARGKR